MTYNTKGNASKIDTQIYRAFIVASHSYSGPKPDYSISACCVTSGEHELCSKLYMYTPTEDEDSFSHPSSLPPPTIKQKYVIYFIFSNDRACRETACSD